MTPLKKVNGTNFQKKEVSKMMKMNRKNLVILALLQVLLIGIVLNSGWTEEPQEIQESLVEIYAKYNQAVKSGDINEMKKYLSSKNMLLEMINQTPAEQIDLFVKHLQSKIITDYEVVRHKIDLDKGEASLYLKRASQDTPNGLVTFIKENGIWKIEGEGWSSDSLK